MIALVCGLGRCGTSLVMQMLHAGGMNVVGDFPAYEDERLKVPGYLPWVRSCEGRALKLLDPFHYQLPFGPSYRAVWLTRDEREQARSQIKFFTTLTQVKVKPDAVERFAASFADHKSRSLATLSSVGASVYQIGFEDLLRDPWAGAERLSSLFDGLDVDAMTRQVQRRDPRCSESLDLELQLIRRGALVA